MKVCDMSVDQSGDGGKDDGGKRLAGGCCLGSINWYAMTENTAWALKIGMLDKGRDCGGSDLT